MYTTKKLTTEQWYDLAQRHANRDWNADGYLESIKAVCADFEALSTPAAADAPEPATLTILRALLATGVAKDVLGKLADGHGTDTEDGKAWLRAAELASASTPDPVAPTDAWRDSIADAHRWDTTVGRRSMIRAALAASQPAPEQSFVPPMMEEGSREAAMVVLERDASGKPTVWCDPEIAPIVGALIKAGIRTSWSCSGHGHRPGVIGLVDGRHLMIFNTDEDHEKAEAVFTTDINGVNDALLES